MTLLTRFVTLSLIQPLGAGGSKSMQDNSAPGGTRIPNLLIRSQGEGVSATPDRPIPRPNAGTTPRIADNRGQRKAPPSHVRSHGKTKNDQPATPRKARDGKVVAQFKSDRKVSGGLRCESCRWKAPAGLVLLGREEAAHMIHAHHVIPIACGGPDTPANLVLLCPTCHAIAHRLGTMSGGVWTGPETPDRLLYEMRLLKKPEEWKAYVRTKRNYGKVLEAREEQRQLDQARSEIAAGTRRPGVVRGGMYAGDKPEPMPQLTPWETALIRGEGA